MIDSDKFEGWRRRFCEARQGNAAFCTPGISRSESVHKIQAALDSLCTSQDLNRLETSWYAKPPQRALHYLEDLVWIDLAYGCEIMGIAEAVVLVREFLSFFPGEKLFFGNFEYDLNGWRPLTKATRDAGIGVVTDSALGLLWVWDED